MSPAASCALLLLSLSPRTQLSGTNKTRNKNQDQLHFPHSLTQLLARSLSLTHSINCFELLLHPLIHHLFSLIDFPHRIAQPISSTASSSSSAATVVVLVAVIFVAAVFHYTPFSLSITSHTHTHTHTHWLALFSVALLLFIFSLSILSGILLLHFHHHLTTSFVGHNFVTNYRKSI